MPKTFLMPLQLIELLEPIQLSACDNNVVGTKFHSIPLNNVEERKQVISCIIPPPIANILSDRLIPFFTRKST